MPRSSEQPKEYSGRVAAVFSVADRLTEWKKNHSIRREYSETSSPDGRFITSKLIVAKESGEILISRHELRAFSKQTEQSATLMRVTVRVDSNQKTSEISLEFDALSNDLDGWVEHYRYVGDANSCTRSTIHLVSFPMWKSKSPELLREFITDMRSAHVCTESELPLVAEIDLKATADAFIAQIDANDFSKPQLIMVDNN